MSQNTIEDPRVESLHRPTEQEKEVETILASANLPLISSSFGLDDVPEYLISPKDTLARERAKKDMEKAERWMGDREALYGFASGVLQGKKTVALKDRETAMEAAEKDPEYELAMKDPAVYFQRIVGGLAKFYEPRTEGTTIKKFTFAKPHNSDEAVTTGIKNVSYMSNEGNDLPSTFSIDFSLPPAFAFGARLSLDENHELIATKTSGHREVRVTDDKAPAYYQAAATLLYRMVCNYRPEDDPVAESRLHWSGPWSPEDLRTTNAAIPVAKREPRR